MNYRALSIKDEKLPLRWTKERKMVQKQLQKLFLAGVSGDY